MVESGSNMGFPTEIIEEGKAKVLVPRLEAFKKTPSDYAPSKAPVFYNPVMKLNRDISVLALQAYQKMRNREISVCEPLTGCGVRGIRYAVEVTGVKNVLLCDISTKAFQLAKYNVQMNRLSERIKVKHGDANNILSYYSAPRKRFDAIDIDPFGSPVPYLDSAIRALRDDGLLALTATDMAPLCGVHQKACIRKYGGKPLRTEYCHELALRLVAGCLAATAAKQEIGVNILFSHCTDHYLRVYATIKHGAKEADASIGTMGFILHCFNCSHRETVKSLFAMDSSRRCSECGSKLSLAGPVWLGKIVDGQFCELMEKETKKRKSPLGGRMEKILALTRSEADAPITYYVIDKLCDLLNLPVPSVKKVAETLKNQGFQAVLTHFNSKGLKTDASAMKMGKILRGIMGDN